MKSSEENWGSWSFVKEQGIMFEPGSNISMIPIRLTIMETQRKIFLGSN